MRCLNGLFFSAARFALVSSFNCLPDRHLALLSSCARSASTGMLDRLKQNISEFKQNVNEIQDVMSFGPTGLFDDNSGNSAGMIALRR